MSRFWKESSQQADGSWFRPEAGQEGARTHQKHCWGTLEQGTQILNKGPIMEIEVKKKTKTLNLKLFAAVVRVFHHVGAFVREKTNKTLMLLSYLSNFKTPTGSVRLCFLNIILLAWDNLWIYLWTGYFLWQSNLRIFRWGGSVPVPYCSPWWLRVVLCVEQPLECRFSWLLTL